MKIVIDGHMDLVMPEEDESLGELLVELKKWMIKENKRVIVRVRLEGKIISEKNEKVVLLRKATEFGILELFTVNLLQWAIDSLKEIEDKLPRIALGMEKVSFLIQKGNYQNAFSLLDKLIEVWDRINEALRYVERLFALDYSQIFPKRKGISGEMEKVKDLLGEANRAMEQNDLLGLADILEYELAPRISEERMAVDKITKLITQQMN